MKFQGESILDLVFQCKIGENPKAYQNQSDEGNLVRSVRCLCVGLLWLVLAGCASLPSSRNPHLSLSQSQSRWHLEGYFGVKTQEHHLQQAFSGNIDWVHVDAPHLKDQITLYGPLGADETVLTYQPQTLATLQTRQGKTYHATTPEVLMQENLGWSVPLEGWRYWVMGQCEPHVPAKIDWNSRGLPQMLTQSGWTIAYSEYQWIPLFHQYRPMEITFERPGLWLKIQVNRWGV